MPDSAVSKYKNAYGKLVSLYPHNFRQRFGESMLQTFGDMCQERLESGEKLALFTVKISGETLVQIIKEHSKEVSMSVKGTRKRLYAVGAGVSTLVLVSVVFFTLNDTDVRGFPPNSTIEEARNSSQGEKEVCLTNNQEAHEAVEKDDSYLDDEQQFSRFGLAVASGIIDVPAGTRVDVNVNSYSNGVVLGAALYEDGYGHYNYRVEKATEPEDWKLISLAGCDLGEGDES